MKKVAFLLFVGVQALTLKAQTVTLNQSYKPNTMYTATVDQKTDMSMTYEGMEPMQQSQNSKMVNKITTGALSGDTMPITMLVTFDKESQQAAMLPEGVKLTGKVKTNASPKFETVEAASMTEPMKDMLLKTMGAMTDQMMLPKKTVKVGESFVYETPLTIPLGVMDMKMKITSTYKLTKVEGKKAFFDLAQVYTLDTKVEGQDLKGSGTGTGKVVYDMDNNFPVQFDTVSNMQMGFQAQGMAMNISVKSDQTNATTITAAK